MNTPAALAVQFSRVSKTFGAYRAAREVSFEIRAGEFFSLLGPSGCGKTTTLRLLAGFEQPDVDGGEVRITGGVVNGKRPYERGLGMVFQSYALFPHLSIERNIAFGLEQRAVPKGEIASRVRRAMQLVRLDPDTYGRRMPAQLSGGQKQRVALARALVVEPPILLLDEPLGALDLKLRKEMQVELKALNRDLGITFVYVTHDQEEALTMSDRIAVMRDGRIAQLGSPEEIYERPRTPFVAKFIGESNFIEAKQDGVVNGRARLVRPDGAVLWTAPNERPTEALICVRPERLHLHAPGEAPSGENQLPATVRALTYRGESLHVRAELGGGGDVVVAVRNEGQLNQRLRWAVGDPAVVSWAPQDGRLLEGDDS
ncbi:ABC transporter ATP-binding protein [Myxococcota bacterium]|nr:ABC transporter ATP-binding protein [Myxococcota bacterium]